MHNVIFCSVQLKEVMQIRVQSFNYLSLPSIQHLAKFNHAFAKFRGCRHVLFYIVWNYFL